MKRSKDHDKAINEEKPRIYLALGGWCCESRHVKRINLTIIYVYEDWKVCQ